MFKSNEDLEFLGMSPIDISLLIQNRIMMWNGDTVSMCISMLFYPSWLFSMLFNYPSSTVCSSSPFELRSEFIVFLSSAISANNNFISCLVGNTVWGIAISYYIYILFLGFSGQCCSLFIDSIFIESFSDYLFEKCSRAFTSIESVGHHLYSFDYISIEFFANDCDILRVSCWSQTFTIIDGFVQRTLRLCALILSSNRHFLFH